MTAHKGSDEWVGRSDYAETFYKRATGALPEMESSKAAATLLAHEVREGDSLLDVGCGAGHYLRSLRNAIAAPFQYTGVDATSQFIEAAGKAWADDRQVTFKDGDIYRLPFADRQFDVVMCNNVLLHLPSIVQPVSELLRVARRFVVIRTPIGERSFRVQEVYSKATWPFSEIPVEDEFDDSGEPASYGFENIYSKGYFESVVRRANAGADIELIEDTSFSAAAINRSADGEGLPIATRVVEGVQVFGYVILPWHFALIRVHQ